jgi:DNA-directed RNA polymerase specialized sigma24 family protein
MVDGGGTTMPDQVSSDIDRLDWEWVEHNLTCALRESCLHIAAAIISQYNCTGAIQPKGALHKACENAAKGKSTFDPHPDAAEPFKPWFEAITRNATKDLCKRELTLRRKVDDARFDLTVTITASYSLDEPELDLDAMSDAKEYREAVSGLSADHQKTWELFWALNMSANRPTNVHEEIALRLKIGENCSKNRVRRARSRIRSCLERYPVTPPDARFVVTMAYGQSERSFTGNPVNDRLLERIAEEMAKRMHADPAMIDRLRHAVGLPLVGWTLEEIKAMVRAILAEIEKRFREMRRSQ